MELFENHIIDAERLLGVHITVHDFGGVFHDSEGKPLLGLMRHSHRQMAVCENGFSNRCLEHCRYSIHRQLETTGKPFIHTCWKGLQEIVVPLELNGYFIGAVFAGIWRRANDREPPNKESHTRAMLTAYQKLKPLPEKRTATLMNHMLLWSRGLTAMLQELKNEGDHAQTRTVQVRSFIREQAPMPIGLADVAKTLSLSPSRTSHLIKELFGVPFQNLLREERVRRVKTLLLSSELPLSVIADRVGFPDEFYLSRVFKAEVGMPPGRFRKEGRSRMAGVTESIPTTT
ncbi:MAG: helix-turn-helix domain-containing protein [Puniceicoccales bacterium]